MRALAAKLAVAAGLVAILAWSVADPHTWLAPGPLARGHAAIERDCLACHVPGRGVPATRCVRCHVPASIGVTDTHGRPVPGRAGNVTVGFHRALADRDCAACHPGHAVRGGPVPHARFTHDLVPAADRRACATCHREPDDVLHRGAGGDCAACHRIEHWSPATFAHDRLFALDRDHAAACETCHPARVYSRYTCYGCHEHTPARMAAEHAEEGVRDLDACARCHRRAEGGHEGRGEGRESGGQREDGGEHDGD